VTDKAAPDESHKILKQMSDEHEEQPGETPVQDRDKAKGGKDIDPEEAAGKPGSGSAARG
jgi:hypothetical protein